jgi:hypothetical protein
MHDPQTVAFDIKYPAVTIWHVDPETDGSDDSCGWFQRARHGDPAVLKRIEREFEFMWDCDRTCWFDKRNGLPQCSTIAITLEMFRRAARAFYDGRRFDQHGWKGSDRLMRRRIVDILAFAENPLDSMRPFIEQVYGPSTDPRDERIRDAAATIYGCLLRWTRPWYRHPRWHVWHWRIQVRSVQAFKRWAFSRCSECGRRFTWGYAPTSGNWDSEGPRWFRGEPGVYHSECSHVMYAPPRVSGQASDGQGQARD